MIRKLLCWLGWHEWTCICRMFRENKYCNWYRSDKNTCSNCHHRGSEQVCKHCGKVNK